ILDTDGIKAIFTFNFSSEAFNLCLEFIIETEVDNVKQGAERLKRNLRRTLLSPEKEKYTSMATVDAYATLGVSSCHGLQILHNRPLLQRWSPPESREGVSCSHNYGGAYVPPDLTAFDRKLFYGSQSFKKAEKSGMKVITTRTVKTVTNVMENAQAMVSESCLNDVDQDSIEQAEGVDDNYQRVDLSEQTSQGVQHRMLFNTSDKFKAVNRRHKKGNYLSLPKMNEVMNEACGQENLPMGIYEVPSRLRKIDDYRQLPTWWRIIDLTELKAICSIVTKTEFSEIRSIITAGLRNVAWTKPDDQLKDLEREGLKKVCEHYEFRGALRELRNLLAEKENENPFLAQNHFGNEKRCYALRDGQKADTTASSDIDIFIKSQIISCFDGIVDRHFGEVVSRASQHRRMNARHDIAKDLAWDQELSLCERAGSKIENGTKNLDNSLKVQRTVRDMHRTLVDTLSETGGGNADSLASFQQVANTRIHLVKFFHSQALRHYVGGGSHISAKFSEFDIPATDDGLSGVVKMARTMLQVKIPKVNRTQMKAKAE
ncbi:736_t:CDS:10, partial [Paraglomus occultum]